MMCVLFATHREFIFLFRSGTHVFMMMILDTYLLCTIEKTIADNIKECCDITFSIFQSVSNVPDVQNVPK